MGCWLSLNSKRGWQGTWFQVFVWQGLYGLYMVGCGSPYFSIATSGDLCWALCCLEFPNCYWFHLTVEGTRTQLVTYSPCGILILSLLTHRITSSLLLFAWVFAKTSSIISSLGSWRKSTISWMVSRRVVLGTLGSSLLPFGKCELSRLHSKDTA